MTPSGPNNQSFLLRIAPTSIASEGRGGPQWLDSLTADLRWKPPAIMPPVELDILPLAVSSMPHMAFCRPEKNEDAPHCNI